VATDRLGYFVGNFSMKSWESNWCVSKSSLFWITPAHYEPMPVSSGRSLVEYSKALANGGDFSSTVVKPLSIVFRCWFRLIRWLPAVARL
jgi:hypothetical protein